MSRRIVDDDSDDDALLARILGKPAAPARGTAPPAAATTPPPPPPPVVEVKPDAAPTAAAVGIEPARRTFTDAASARSKPDAVRRLVEDTDDDALLLMQILGEKGTTQQPCPAAAAAAVEPRPLAAAAQRPAVANRASPPPLDADRLLATLQGGKPATSAAAAAVADDGDDDAMLRRILGEDEPAAAAAAPAVPVVAAPPTATPPKTPPPVQEETKKDEDGACPASAGDGGDDGALWSVPSADDVQALKTSTTDAREESMSAKKESGGGRLFGGLKMKFLGRGSKENLEAAAATPTAGPSVQQQQAEAKPQVQAQAHSPAASGGSRSPGPSFPSKSASPASKKKSGKGDWSDLEKIQQEKKTKTPLKLFAGIEQDLSLHEERAMLQQIIDDMDESEVSTVADSDLGLNDAGMDVDAILRNAEKIANDKRHKGAASESTHMGPLVPSADLNIMNVSNFQEVSTELNQRRSDVGWPVCLATAAKAQPLAKRSNATIAYAVGTSGGVIVLFTDAGKRCGILGGAQSDEAPDRGTCTTVDLLPTGEAVVAGFQTGEVVFFDTTTGHVMRSTRECTAPVHAVRWLTSEISRAAAAVLDIAGHLKVCSLKKVPGLKAKYMVQTQEIAKPEVGILEMDAVCILPQVSQQDSVEPVCLLAAASRSLFQVYKLKSHAEPFFQQENAHYVPPNVAGKQTSRDEENAGQRHGKPRGLSLQGGRLTAANRREQRLEAERRRRERLRAQRAEALPCVSWLHRERDPEVVVVWNDYLHVYKADSAAALRPDGTPTLTYVSHIMMRHAAVSCVFMSLRVVGVVDTHGHTVLVDPRAPANKATADVSSQKTEPIGVATAQTGIKSCRQAVRGLVTEKGAVLCVLSRPSQGPPIRMTRVKVLTWEERLDALEPSRDALNLAKAMKEDKAVAVVGLPSLVSARERVLNERVETLLRAFMREQVSRGSTDGIELDMWWRAIGNYTFRFCCTAGCPHLIFHVLYRYFAEGGAAATWIALLEPCVVRGMVKGIPDHHLTIIAEWLKHGGLLTHARDGVVECSGDASAKCVDTAYDVVNNSRLFTLDLHVRVRETGGEQCPICSVDDKRGGGWAVLLIQNAWCLSLSEGSDRTMVFDESDSNVSTGTWTRLTAQYDGEAATLFVDGVRVGHSVTAAYVPNQQFPLRIGGYVEERTGGSGIIQATKLFKGDVRDVKLYSSVHNPFSSMLDDWEDGETDSDGDEGEDARLKGGGAGTGNDGGSSEHADSTLELDDVVSAVSSDGDSAEDFSSLHNSTRLDNILLHLEQIDTGTVGGRFATVLEMAERMHLYKSFVSYHNKATPNGFVAPFVPLYSLLGAPLVGSRVEFAKQKGEGLSSGTVAGRDGGSTMLVLWDGAEGGAVQRIAAKELSVLPDSSPNCKARHTLLRYLKLLLKGRTFYKTPVPKEKLLDVKSQALDMFLFWDDGSDKKAVHRSYPVLESLLLSDASSVISALEVAFADDTPSLSPWRKILKTNAKPPVLIEAPQADKRARLSRDQVVAVLFRLLHVYEHKPFEVAETFARAWPTRRDMVNLFKLVARGVARGIVQPKKFKEPRETVKRVVAHLAFECPEHDRTARQKLLEDMLAAALDPASECWKDAAEGDMTDLRRIAQEAGFTLLQIYLCKRDANYSAVLRMYLQAYQDGESLLEKDAMFDFLESTLAGVGHNATATHIQNLEKAVLEHLPTLIKVDPNKAAGLVTRHLQEEHGTILVGLDCDKKTQFAYLRGLMDAAGAKDDDAPAGLFDTPTLERYVRLLCIYDDANLLQFIREHEATLEVHKVLRSIENTRVDEPEPAAAEPPPPLGGSYPPSLQTTAPLARSGDGREDAIIYLYSKIGKFTAALDLLFKRLKSKMQEVRHKLILSVKRETGDCTNTVTGGCTLSQYSPLGMLSTGGLKSTPSVYDETAGRSFHRISSEYTDKTMSVTQEIFDSHEGKAVSDLIGLGLDLCSDSMRNGTEDVTVVWFSMLEKFIKPKKILSEVEAESRGLMKVEAVVVAGLTAATVVTLLALRRLGTKYVLGNNRANNRILKESKRKK